MSRLDEEFVSFPFRELMKEYNKEKKSEKAEIDRLIEDEEE